MLITPKENQVVLQGEKTQNQILQTWGKQAGITQCLQTFPLLQSQLSH